MRKKRKKIEGKKGLWQEEGKKEEKEKEKCARNRRKMKFIS